MYILVRVQNDDNTEEKHVRYILRNAHESYTFDFFDDAATIVHQQAISPIAFNITEVDGDPDLKPERALAILEDMVKHLHAQGLLVNLTDYKPYADGKGQAKK